MDRTRPTTSAMETPMMGRAHSPGGSCGFLLLPLLPPASLRSQRHNMMDMAMKHKRGRLLLHPPTVQLSSRHPLAPSTPEHHLGSLRPALARHSSQPHVGLLHPARLRRHAAARRAALHGLVVDLAEQRNKGVVTRPSIRYALFGLVATMCFGDGIDTGRGRAMADAQSDLVKSLATARVFAHAKLRR
ncbi:hypothetical protein ZWY2020_010615 [Hordeum vulgare]|nr:hypothetical protein ZWY2020_010615 [Hordeum vulgare]